MIDLNKYKPVHIVIDCKQSIDDIIKEILEYQEVYKDLKIVDIDIQGYRAKTTEELQQDHEMKLRQIAWDAKIREQQVVALKENAAKLGFSLVETAGGQH